VHDATNIFRELAPLLRVRPDLDHICRFGSQWTSRHDPDLEGCAPFHIVTKGQCLLDAADNIGLLLKAGDIAILPHGGPHTVRALHGAAESKHAVRVERRLHDQITVKTNVRGDHDTELICGRLIFEHAHNNLVFAALPPVITFFGADAADAVRLRAIVTTIQSELAEDRFGAAPIACALASSLMMYVLRSHFESKAAGIGILALLARNQTARVLSALLAEIDRAWSLDELAKVANTSRATLVRLFRKSVNVPPLMFLSELRLTLARHHILASNKPLVTIADEIGYQSETAFSRAYHRRFGVAPGADRKGRI
jgi:AraC family transcriptional regulator, activator of mtrCDE